jgi:putative PIN family toxin of toxin-antitoxin system
MITAILDTNVILQGISSPHASASARAVDAFHDGRFRLAFSQATIDELLAVLSLPHIRPMHGLTDDGILEFIQTLLANATEFPIAEDAVVAGVRDVSDRKFLALAQESNAEYFVTNDRRHLLPLGRYHRTEIVTPAEFLERLAAIE